MNFVPGYAALNTALGTPRRLSDGEYSEGLPLAILVPWLVLRFLGLRPETLTFDRKDLKPALPFLVIYRIAFVATGIDFERLLFLGYALLYAGVQEDSFRGYAASVHSSAAPVRPEVCCRNSTVRLLHIPDYLFRLYSPFHGPMAVWPVWPCLRC